MKIFLSIFLLLILGNTTVNALPVATPQKSVEAALDLVIEAINQTYTTPAAKRKSVLLEVEKIFDFEEMSKRSLGSYWNKYEENEKKEFISAFSDFLGNTYLGKIEKVHKDMIQFDSEQIKKDKAYVKTTVSIDDTKFPINYKMFVEDNQWKVYDVVIENVGLISNYRNEFSGFLRKNNLTDLTARLVKKVAES